jgi:hypothetical protein
MCREITGTEEVIGQQLRPTATASAISSTTEFPNAHETAAANQKPRIGWRAFSAGINTSLLLSPPGSLQSPSHSKGSQPSTDIFTSRDPSTLQQHEIRLAGESASPCSETPLIPGTFPEHINGPNNVNPINMLLSVYFWFRHNPIS